MCSYPGLAMPRSLRLLALLLAGTLLLGAPPSASAAARLTASPSEVHAGQVVELAWSGLSEATEEVELEYAMPGGRWTRLSPELEAEEREYRWRTPAGVSGEVRVRLRAGERHEESVAAEIALRLVAEAHLEPAQGVRSHDAWDLDRPARGPSSSQWSAAHPTWSAGRDLPALATTAGAGDDVAPERFALRAPVGSRHGPAPRTTRRAFESRRNPPLRN